MPATSPSNSVRIISDLAPTEQSTKRGFDTNGREIASPDQQREVRKHARRSRA
jgi:hypothetical protein